MTKSNVMLKNIFSILIVCFLGGATYSHAWDSELPIASDSKFKRFGAEIYKLKETPTLISRCPELENCAEFKEYGVIIGKMHPDSPWYRAGLRTGDIIHHNASMNRRHNNLCGQFDCNSAEGYQDLYFRFLTHHTTNGFRKLSDIMKGQPIPIIFQPMKGKTNLTTTAIAARLEGYDTRYWEKDFQYFPRNDDAGINELLRKNKQLKVSFYEGYTLSNVELTIKRGSTDWLMDTKLSTLGNPICKKLMDDKKRIPKLPVMFPALAHNFNDPDTPYVPWSFESRFSPETFTTYEYSGYGRAVHTANIANYGEILRREKMRKSVRNDLVEKLNKEYIKAQYNNEVDALLPYDVLFWNQLNSSESLPHELKPYHFSVLGGYFSGYDIFEYYSECSPFSRDAEGKKVYSHVGEQERSENLYALTYLKHMSKHVYPARLRYMERFFSSPLSLTESEVNSHYNAIHEATKEIMKNQALTHREEVLRNEIAYSPVRIIKVSKEDFLTKKWSDDRLKYCVKNSDLIGKSYSECFENIPFEYDIDVTPETIKINYVGTNEDSKRTVIVY